MKRPEGGVDPLWLLALKRAGFSPPLHNQGVPTPSYVPKLGYQPDQPLMDVPSDSPAYHPVSETNPGP